MEVLPGSLYFGHKIQCGLTVKNKKSIFVWMKYGEHAMFSVIRENPRFLLLIRFFFNQL